MIFFKLYNPSLLGVTHTSREIYLNKQNTSPTQTRGKGDSLSLSLSLSFSFFSPSSLKTPKSMQSPFLEYTITMYMLKHTQRNAVSLKTYTQQCICDCLHLSKCSWYCKMQCLLKFVLLNAPKSNKTRQVFGPVFVRKSADIAL